jgi:hypothetical protein
MPAFPSLSLCILDSLKHGKCQPCASAALNSSMPLLLTTPTVDSTPLLYEPWKITSLSCYLVTTIEKFYQKPGIWGLLATIRSYSQWYYKPVAKTWRIAAFIHSPGPAKRTSLHPDQLTNNRAISPEVSLPWGSQDRIFSSGHLALRAKR